MINEAELKEYLIDKKTVSLYDLQVRFRASREDAAKAIEFLQEREFISRTMIPGSRNYAVLIFEGQDDPRFSKFDSDDKAGYLNDLLSEAFPGLNLVCASVISAHSYTRYEVRAGKSDRIEYSTFVKLDRRQPELLEKVFGFDAKPLRIVYERNLIVIEVNSADRDPVFLESYTDKIGQGEFVLGEDYSRSPLKINLFDSANPNLFVAGQSGTGKTELLKSTLAQLSWRTEPCNLRIDLFDLNDRQGESPLAQVMDAYPPLFEQCVLFRKADIRYGIEQAFRRYESNKKIGPGEKSFTDSGMVRYYPTAYLTIIDELYNLVGDPELKDCADSLMAMLKDGWKYGVFFIVTSERPDLCGDFLNEFPNRLTFRYDLAGRSKMGLRDRGIEALNGEGDGLFMTRNKPMVNPIRIQTLSVPSKLPDYND